MHRLRYKDIVNRQRDLILENHSYNKSLNISALYDDLLENYSFSKAKIILENWNELSSNEDIALSKTLNVFDQVIQHDTIGNIKTAASIIEGKTVKKLRGPRATELLNHYKRGKFKIQNTKAQHHNDDNNNAVKMTIANKGHFVNTLHKNRKYKRDIYGKRVDEEIDKQSSSESSSDEKDKVVEECYNNFITTSWVNEQCDRVLNNHNKLIKRFDIESTVRHMSFSESSIIDTIFDICSLIEGYDIPFGVRYNVALENILYLMNKNCVPVENKLILESVTDYFLMQDIGVDEIVEMGYVIENSKFYSDEELQSVEYVSEYAYELVEESKKHLFKKMDKKKIKENEKADPKGRNKIKEAIKEFKMTHPKTVSGLEKCIARIFVNSPGNIINELPDIFYIVRVCLVIGMFAVHPVVGIIGLITGFFLKMKVSRSYMEKVIKQYEKERDLYKKRMNETEKPKKKEKYQKLYKKINEDIKKLENYRDELYTEKELEKREEEKYAKEAENDDDFDFNFDEQVMIDYVECIASITESIIYTKDELSNVIKSNIKLLDSEDIYNLTESVSLCNDIFDCKEYVNILEDERTRLKTNPSVKDYQKIDTLKICIDEVNEIKYDNLLESYSLDDMDNIPYDIIYEEAKCKYEIMNDTLDLITRYSNPLLEAKHVNDKKNGLSFTSKLKIAKENLKKNMLKLKDKERQASKAIDAETTRFTQAAKAAMINDSREAVIKGRLLPSASKTIKLALASAGTAILFSPVYAVIGILGWIGCSHKLNEKERTLILDDIDIEIEMCDKYLHIAENKDDLVAVREIMKTKRDLQRQRSRIMYNKNYIIKGKKSVDYNPKTYKDRYKND